MFIGFLSEFLLCVLSVKIGRIFRFRLFRASSDALNSIGGIVVHKNKNKATGSILAAINIS